MGNLISRSELLKHSRKVTEYDEAGYSRVYRAVSVEDIKYQPTAYDVDKVVEELEELISMFEENNSQIRYERYCKANRKCKAMDCFTCVLSHAIEIVKGGGVNERD
jgi:hypothetical protein